MSSNGSPPVVYHPTPRRPFAIHAAAPLEDYDRNDDPQVTQQRKESADSDPFLEPQLSSTAELHASSTLGESGSISRAQSIRNLTASTLFGIFSPGVASRDSIGGGSSGIFDSSTPWGAGTETPARGPVVEERRFEADGHEPRIGGTAASAAEIDAVRKASESLMMLQNQHRKAANPVHDGGSGTEFYPAPSGRPSENHAAASTATSTSVPTSTAQSRAYVVFSIISRAALLFTLGMGYGVLVARLRSETHVAVDGIAASTSTLPESITSAVYDASYDWRYLVSWGFSGIVLGTLLPWFDGVWDRTFGRSGTMLGKARTAPETDWALVVRGIGAFAGVVFAMRKLPWASTTQASLTLALANPFLWYLLDRSKSGLLLSAAVGFIGSGVLMALNLDLMPNPGTPASSTHAGYGSTMGSAFGRSSGLQNNSSRDELATEAAGGNRDIAANPVTAETAVWMLSVLFCSCVCFGNIGRRLALRPAYTTREQ